MPEGPEIRRAADQLGRALHTQVVERVEFFHEHLKSFEKTLNRQQVTRFETRGKALLTRFANGWTIYSHNQLYGKWLVCKPNQAPATNRQLRLGLYARDAWLLLYSASDIAVLNDQGVAEHPFLRKLGPDILSEKPSPSSLSARLNSSAFSGRAIAGVLLDQGFAAGLGNYLRSEILFRARVNPRRRARDLSSTERQVLAVEIIQTSAQAYRERGVTNDLQRAKEMKRDGYTFEQYRFWVFERDGLDCYRCASTIVREVESSRRIYHCPTCQPMPS